jgi:hypothetical protein
MTALDVTHSCHAVIRRWRSRKETFVLKVLVSTLDTQGDRPGDFTWVPEGELVARYGIVCDDERADGGGCGCGRAFSGLTTHKATTSAKVVERDMTEADWRAVVYQTLHETGWAKHSPPDEVAEIIDDIVRHDLRAVEDLPAGTVVGRRAWNDDHGDTFDEMVLRRSPP